MRTLKISTYEHDCKAWDNFIIKISPLADKGFNVEMKKHNCSFEFDEKGIAWAVFDTDEDYVAFMLKWA
jgi:hypothetical protein